MVGTINGLSRVAMPLFALSSGAQAWQVGIVGGLGYMGVLLMALPMGAWIDRHGSHTMFLRGAIVAALLYLLLPLLHSPWQVIARRGAARLCAAVSHGADPDRVPRDAAATGSGQGGVEPRRLHDGPVVHRARGVGGGAVVARLHGAVPDGDRDLAAGVHRRPTRAGATLGRGRPAGRRAAACAHRGADHVAAPRCRGAAHDGDRLPRADVGGVLRGVRDPDGDASLRHDAAGRGRADHAAGRALRGRAVQRRHAGGALARRPALSVRIRDAARAVAALRTGRTARGRCGWAPR